MLGSYRRVFAVLHFDMYDVPYLTSKFAPFCPLMEGYDWPNYAKAKKRKRKLQS